MPGPARRQKDGHRSAASLSQANAPAAAFAAKNVSVRNLQIYRLIFRIVTSSRFDDPDIWRIFICTRSIAAQSIFGARGRSHRIEWEVGQAFMKSTTPAYLALVLI